jgi:phosphoketolase
MAATLDQVMSEISAIQHAARSNGSDERPAWPMIILISLLRQPGFCA